ncbi:MAG: hypothetical protein M1817_003413 [Caeruleum heppii]|nr:MAG: hypothetical protein M1817_003413 [Caeruleum heppii]
MAAHIELSHIHPHAFAIQAHRSNTSTPIPSTSTQRATSSSIEAREPTAHDHDPVARHPPHSSSHDTDLEDQRRLAYTQENDPYQLSSGLKTSSELSLIQPRSARRFKQCTPSLMSSQKRKAKKLYGFYERQNENIERLLKPVDEHRRLAKEEHSDNQLKFKIAIHGSFIANVILAILQVYGAVSSGSLSLFTTMADAIFDPLSNVTLILSNRAVNRVDARAFPSGKARIETAGNIFFCFIMCAVSFILIVMSAQELSTHNSSTHPVNGFNLPSVIAVAIAFVTKLALFAYCWALRNTYSQVHILWEDHRNDLLVNGFGILTSVGGSKLRWWIDPMGAIILSCLIVFLWLRTAYSEFQLLIGVTAGSEIQQLITYISMTHSPMITHIDTVRAYHSGPRIIVEVDVVMNPNETLRATHDVAEELQMKLESLPDVERAYVHVDYETEHKPEHFLKKEL